MYKDVKKNIISISYNLFKEKGYDNVTINDICDKCNITKTTFYRYISSKEDILTYFFDQINDELYDLINKHFKATASPFAKTILNDYINWLPHFKKLVPKDYQKIMTIIKEYEDRGYPLEAAKLEAFNRMHGIKEEYHG